MSKISYLGVIPVVLVAMLLTAIVFTSCGPSAHLSTDEHNQISISQCVKAGGIPIFDHYDSNNPLMTRCDTPPNCYSR
jgi:hypothetical protein